MKISATGQTLIKAFESCLKPLGDGRFTTYRCPADVVTIGWGTTRADVPSLREGEVWTQARCDDVFAASLGKYEAIVERHRGSTALTTYQNDALGSWAYNVGERADSQVWVAVKAADHASVPKYLARWNKAAGKVLAGLERRRKAEGQLYVGDVIGASKTAQTILPGTMPQMQDMPAPKPGVADAVIVTVKKGVKPAAGSSLGWGPLWVWWESLSTGQQITLSVVLVLIGVLLVAGVAKGVKHELEHWA